MGAIPPLKCCGLYLPGHEVHWIQTIHSNDPGEVPPVLCRIVEIRFDGTTVIELEGRRVELWTHDPRRLQAIVREHGDVGSYQERWRLLRVPHEREAGIRGNWCIDVTPASNPERRPCPTKRRRHTTLAEQLSETGGFSIPAGEVDRWLDQVRGGGAAEPAD